MMYSMGPRPPKPQTDGLEKPNRLSEYPAYMLKRAKGFCSRLFYIVSLVWESAPLMLIAMSVLCILDGVLPVAGAYISKDLINGIADLIGASSVGSITENLLEVMRPLIFLFVAYFIYLFLKRLLGRINTMITGIAGELVVNHIKLKIINKAKTVDQSSFDCPEFYEKLENANREAGMRPIHILTATFNVVSAMISAVSFVVVLATLSPWAPVLIIGAAIPGALVNYVYRNQNFRYMRHHSKERRAMTYYSGVMTNKDLAKEVKLLGLGDTFVKKYKEVFRKYYAGLRRLIIKEGVVQILVGLLSTLVICLLFVFVAYNIIFEGGEIGDYSLYTGALTSISGYITTLVTATASIYEGTLFINNMIEFLAEESTVVPTVAEPIVPEKGVGHTMEFVGVSFAYPGTDRRVIENLNLKLDPNDSVVLVGLNGAGKTTLIKLMTRLYDPTEGVILLDGRDIREYDTAAYYDLFGIVFQDYGKYAVSVSENIEFGDVRRDHRREDVTEAARSADAHEYIERLPRGYDTALTRLFEEDGIELSGGQWQKISVARAFYKESDILILDEPTAALDAIAEKEVFDRFSELSEGKLTVFVSHRLSSAVSASKIVVLDGGRVAEVGNHAELMSRGGIYHRLFTTQASKYVGESTEPEKD